MAECDNVLPVTEERFEMVSQSRMRQKMELMRNFKFEEKEHEELQYLDLIKDILPMVTTEWTVLERVPFQSLVLRCDIRYETIRFLC